MLKLDNGVAQRDPARAFLMLGGDFNMQRSDVERGYHAGEKYLQQQFGELSDRVATSQMQLIQEMLDNMTE
eukprot:4961826-Karenia_brevis.AAC.1